jgi:hypothetical protein
VRSQNVYGDGLRLDDVAYIDDQTHRRTAVTAHLAEFLKGYIDAAEPEQGWLFPSRSEAGQRSTTRTPS